LSIVHQSAQSKSRQKELCLRNGESGRRAAFAVHRSPFTVHRSPFTFRVVAKTKPEVIEEIDRLLGNL